MVLLIISAIIVCQVLMLVYYVRFSREKQVNEVEAGNGKNWDIMHDAIKKSQALIGNSELEAIKQSATIEQIIKEGTAKAGEDYKHELTLQTQEIKRLGDGETKKMLAEFRDQFEKNMHEIQDGFAKDLALYKAKKEQTIDNNAEEIIDRAVELYLGKKLDKKEQMQMIFEALERAKNEKQL